MALTIEHKNFSSTSVLYDTDKKTMVVSLPQVVIFFQIITRVPAKSVIRFKCVSKQWKSFLMSDRFKEIHSRNLLKCPHLEDPNFIFFSQEAARFFTFDCESSLDYASCSRRLPRFEASPPKSMRILTSYHGLVCLRYYTHDYKDSYIILWNPLTTEYKKLSKPANPDHMECYKVLGSGYGLYYSSCEDDYKLLVLAESGNVYIYSLKSDSWRKLNKNPVFEPNICSDWRQGFCLNENLFLPSIAYDSIRFDTTVERFHLIKTPPDLNDNIGRPFTAAITVHKGSIHLCVKHDTGRTGIWNSTCIELWKLNADGYIWSKVVTYKLMPNYGICCLSPLHLMSNGNWLMRSHRYGGGRICQVDLKKKKFYDEYKLSYYSNVIVSYPEKVGYTETFVSPNQYMK